MCGGVLFQRTRFLRHQESLNKTCGRLHRQAWTALHRLGSSRETQIQCRLRCSFLSASCLLRWCISGAIYTEFERQRWPSLEWLKASSVLDDKGTPISTRGVIGGPLKSHPSSSFFLSGRTHTDLFSIPNGMTRKQHKQFTVMAVWSGRTQCSVFITRHGRQCRSSLCLE